MSLENKSQQNRALAKRRKKKKAKSALINSALVVILSAVFIFAVLFIGGAFDESENEPSADSSASISKNESSQQIEDVSKDDTPPVISGVADQTVYEGDAISYLRGVTAEDETDPKPNLKVDNSSVNLTVPGEYTVIYTATDASGNKSTVTSTVTVLKKQENHVDLETIYAEADAKLAKIVNKDEPLEEQISDIYKWARANLAYGGHSDRTDFRQAAYVMLTQGKGDCYGYFAVTKLFFERLGIPNIDVEKVKNFPEDSNHFWSLVSYDGEETWYHFDATPRVGSGDDFCLVTDAFLDAYSEKHKRSHNRDVSLYPATP